MINSISNVSVANVSAVQASNSLDKCQNTNLLKQNANLDSVSFKGKENLSDEEKKKLILKARTKAAGYAFWGGLLSSLYYGLRSDEKIARKYDLDPVEDKKLIRQIKKEQTLWTLPATISNLLVFGGPLVGLGSYVIGGGAYLYNKCVATPDDIKLNC